MVFDSKSRVNMQRSSGGKAMLGSGYHFASTLLESHEITILLLTQRTPTLPVPGLLESHFNPQNE